MEFAKQKRPKETKKIKATERLVLVLKPRLQEANQQRNSPLSDFRQSLRTSHSNNSLERPVSKFVIRSLLEMTLCTLLLMRVISGLLLMIHFLMKSRLII